MYHEVTVEMIRRRRRRVIVVALAVLIIVALVAGFVYASRDTLREQAASSLRDAIMNSALQCCAIEGSYPQTLRYLEDNYGLSVNHEDYVVTYEAFASNVVPSVMVVPR
ncbi:hypothetical protein GMI69_06575 [Eggerthellaceae bacterium zg-887]|uniref:hypothetical protein n=1 Tax=Xiamenia xianingshaonis TaxID=2682776 RepID=UPI00140A9F3D|nr:hypothetical protein [Xiamenia xianingshaonis]NHM16322.1 hypothetical protein [Xiamenia xianingshaonis]